MSLLVLELDNFIFGCNGWFFGWWVVIIVFV